MGPTKDRKGLMPPKRTEKNIRAPKRTCICHYILLKCMLKIYMIEIFIYECNFQEHTVKRMSFSMPKFASNNVLFGT